MSDLATTTADSAPRRWTDIARDLAEAGAFQIGVRPWNWLELGADEAALVWELLEGFVDFLNQRYGVDLATRVPPCWAEHGAVIEELTTLAFSHWQAFGSEQASIAGAQTWHSGVLPAFYERLGRWLKGTRTSCDVGRHRELEHTPRGDVAGWRARSRAITAADVTRRKQRDGAARTITALHDYVAEEG